jgi:hypothetical protein
MALQPGFILFAVGIIATIIGAAKVPDEMSEWPDTLGLFGLGVVLSTLGLILWYRTRRANTAAANADQASTGAGDPVALLLAAQEPLMKLAADIGELNADDITERVDAILEAYILPFSQVRQRLIDRLGMETAAEVLVVVAYGERILNRVWSAAGDAHLPEARTCFPEAHEALVEAARMVGYDGEDAPGVDPRGLAESIVV